MDFYQKNTQLTIALAGIIAGWILTKVLPTLISFIIRLIKIVGKKFGGRLAYKSINDTYLNWVVLQNQDLNLTGIIGEGEKPKLEQIFTSLSVIGERDEIHKKRKDETKEEERYLSKIKIFIFVCLNDVKKNIIAFSDLLFISTLKLWRQRDLCQKDALFKPNTFWRFRLFTENDAVSTLLILSIIVPFMLFFVILSAILLILLPAEFLVLSFNISTIGTSYGAFVWTGILIIGYKLIRDHSRGFYSYFIYSICAIILSTFIYLIYYKIYVSDQSPYAMGYGMLSAIIFAIFLPYINLETNFDDTKERTATEVGDLLTSHDNIAILGKPGSGKSTYAQFIALTFAQEKAGEKNLKKIEL